MAEVCGAPNNMALFGIREELLDLSYEKVVIFSPFLAQKNT